MTSPFLVDQMMTPRSSRGARRRGGGGGGGGGNPPRCLAMCLGGLVGGDGSLCRRRRCWRTAIVETERSMHNGLLLNSTSCATGSARLTACSSDSSVLSLVTALFTYSSTVAALFSAVICTRRELWPTESSWS